MANHRSRRECDLVMKGGITSGIVYPSLVLALKDAYTFRSVGGTSAGAMAAAVTAAAELGRDKGGFDRLRELRDYITQGTNLIDLFQPTRVGRPLMELALHAMRIWTTREGQARRLAIATEIVWPRARLGALLGAGAGLLAWLALTAFVGGAAASPGGKLAALVSLLFGAAVGGAAGAIAWAWRVGRAAWAHLPADGFGLCTGRHDAPGQSDRPALTDWLAAQLHACAGLPATTEVMTFGHLWQSPDGARDPESRRIDLRIFTSNVTLGQPYVFPLAGDEMFIFRVADFERYFGHAVVNHMMEHPGKHGQWCLPPGYHFFPPPEHFPVIVATRMSFGFPGLFGAVPAYTLPADAEEGEPIEAGRLQKNWFSDGGICSNFPIHFFDAWLPSRPTFGINLTNYGRDAGLHAPAPSARNREQVNGAATDRPADVFLPEPDLQIFPQFTPIESLLGFVAGILSTAKDCHDKTQSTLPSYRERIVQIRLRDDEGGLNLAMPPGVIRGVIGKGETAGELLRGRFDFDIHQWIRFRVLMKELEASLRDMDRTVWAAELDGKFDLSGLLDRQRSDPRFPYRIEDKETCDEVLELVRHIRRLIAHWKDHVSFQDPSIWPDPVLRVVPPDL